METSSAPELLTVTEVASRLRLTIGTVYSLINAGRLPAFRVSERGLRHLDLDNWRRREWKPALEAAGIDRRRIYDLRPTAITNWLAAGLSVFEVSRYAGTSLAMISSVYGHLALGHEANARARLDAFANVRAASVPQGADALE
jgi:excisionase family DNA binding protein